MNSKNIPKRINNVPILLFVLGGAFLFLFFNNKSNIKDVTQPEFERAVKGGFVTDVRFVPTKEYEGGGQLSGKISKDFIYDKKDVKTDGSNVVSAKGGQDVVVKYALDINSIKKLLDTHKVSYIVEPDNSILRDFIVFFLPILLLIGFIYFLMSKQMKGMKNGPMQFGKSRARAVMEDEIKTTFKDVAGVDEAREDVEEIVDFLKNPKKYAALGGRLPKGCLMVGPPGTGKTLLARAIAGEAKVPFFFINGSDFVEMFVGVGASRVRDLFEQARQNEPCLIFIDEIDAIGGARSANNGGGGGHDEREQTLNALLVEMDGFSNQEGVIVIGATNRVDVLDKALLRPGRFDRQVVVDLPDVKGRYEILQVHAKKVKLSEDVNLNDIARASAGLSGADLANLINEGALMAAKESKKAVAMADLEEARDKVCWGKERRSRKVTEADRALTAYHEAGHTIISLHSKKAKPLHKVTIIPRGNAYLGAMMSFPTDSFTNSKSELIDEICISMGGKLAEEKIFGESTNGASSDIANASKIARYMVCEWGMSDKIGFLRYKDENNQSFVHQYGEDVANEIDQEVKGIMHMCYDKTKKLLDDKSDQLEKLAKELLDKEALSAKEIYELLDLPYPEYKKAEENESIKASKQEEEKDEFISDIPSPVDEIVVASKLES